MSADHDLLPGNHDFTNEAHGRAPYCFSSPCLVDLIYVTFPLLPAIHLRTLAELSEPIVGNHLLALQVPPYSRPLRN